MCERRCICSAESLLNIFPQKRQPCWRRPAEAALKREAEPCEAPPEAEYMECWLDRPLAELWLKKDSPLCPLAEVVLGDFSWR